MNDTRFSFLGHFSLVQSKHKIFLLILFPSLVHNHPHPTLTPIYSTVSDDVSRLVLRYFLCSPFYSFYRYFNSGAPNNLGTYKTTLSPTSRPKGRTYWPTGLVSESPVPVIRTPRNPRTVLTSFWKVYRPRVPPPPSPTFTPTSLFTLRVEPPKIHELILYTVSKTSESSRRLP